MFVLHVTAIISIFIARLKKIFCSFFYAANPDIYFKLNNGNNSHAYKLKPLNTLYFPCNIVYYFH